ncbi:MAG TPA: ATP-dependent RecD-like DNA helicase [Bacillus sp. (in: firmicutes)]|uniref:SF1B family DNA helicase RecD2 n=1 Tax=Bacillus litorisediminis TaxID=2922713 RepID=UPI001FAF7C51|nr:ATP-dependent RecD-like DNA helicase [Bacillus litorisediminis]HWO74754.1 ATP-dependent RecD-like DNA helicase [Bacillus sp. (in: firmicutes)]
MRQESFNLFAETEKFIKGRPIVTIFHNESNLYTVVRIRVEETDEIYDEKEAVVTGYFPRIHEEDTYKFYGVMKEHPKFGLQFHAHRYEKDIPKTKDGVIQYLSSDLFPGVGKKTAASIVEALGENAISRILENPHLLENIPKLSPEKAQLIHETIQEHQGLEEVMITLSQLGFGPQISMKIYQTYRELTLQIINDNPYKLVEDVDGVGFAKADELGEQMGISGEHPDRIKAAILFTLEKSCLQEGHVFLVKEPFLYEVKKLLESNQPKAIDTQLVETELVKLQEEGKIKVQHNRVYMISLYFAERGIVSNIERLLSQDQYKDQFSESEFLLALGKLEERLGIQYAPTQKTAIQQALTSPMLLLTGGPGTGKTTVIKGIVDLYAELHGLSLNPKDYKDEPFPVVLAAPTGRAAKRMNEATGLPAVTIHRLLGWNGSEAFQYDEEQKIEGRLLIIDEMSMVDTWLAHQLFKALPDDIQVILVGDEDQLPSVGPGQVLRDLLDSEKIPTVRLTDIYRQEDGSSIVDLAHQIKNGEVPPNLTEPKKDRSFIPCRPLQMGDVVQQIVQNALKKGFSKKDIQVLAPMYKGPAGIDALNTMLQDVMNPNSDKSRKEVTFGDKKYRIGDKVLQLVNRPEDQIFNGDIGEIISIIRSEESQTDEKQDQLVVSFDGIEVYYPKAQWNEITLAYCCSIHKSQGSEFPIVILPVVKSYYRMLRRNLLYTAVTRSKQFLILCGEPEAFKMGVMRQDDRKRQTSLAEKLLELDKTSTDSLFLTEEDLFQVDPMIGMENTSPYDFLPAENE